MGASLPDRQLSEIIGLIYDCALHPAKWGEALEALGNAFQSVALILTLNDLERDQALVDRSVGWDPEWRQRRDQHLPEVHACLNEWFSITPSLDEPFVASRHLAKDYIAQSPYVREVLNPLGISDVMHLFLMRTPAHVSELVVMHHEGKGLATEREIQLAALLLPHLRRSVTISGVLDAKELERDYLAETLDRIDVGVILTAEDGSVLHSNTAGTEILRESTILLVDRGALATRRPAATRELRRAISLAGRDETRVGSAGIAVRLDGTDAAPASAHVLPLISSMSRKPGPNKAVAAVFIGRPPKWEAAAKLVSSTFGLTAAEKRVLTELLSGNTLTAAARSLDISVNTAKCQLNCIFSKTGVHRQPDLARLAMQTITMQPNLRNISQH